ncbi:MAG TPA: hypothetical protein VF881_13595 [Polyangiaceae bacterium]
MLRGEPIRNPALVAEIESAVARRSYRDLFARLCRSSGLPGPRPNHKLAWAVGEAIAKHARRADALVAELCSIDAERAPAKSAAEFLSIVGAYSLAARFLAGIEADAALVQLRTLAEDARHLVRTAVGMALDEIAALRGEELVARLATWTDGYLAAAVAVEALGSRSWLDVTKAPGELFLRLDEAFGLVEQAPRADQRSQGYRTLIKALSDAPARVMDRFPDATLAWLEGRATTEHVELREALSTLIDRARARGHALGKFERLEQLLAASAPPRRDPKTYVGPTRKRGARRR